MLERLFVYGTLAPGKENHHWLSPLKGAWHPATAKGSIEIQTIGSHAGLPCFIPSKTKIVEGLIFTSNELYKIWDKLDEFEGVDYIRRLMPVISSDGEELQAFIYLDVKSL